jgi:hypothetical protein
VVQPFARSFGYVRGLLRPPDSCGEVVAAAPPAAPQPLPRIPRRYLALPGVHEYRFWSETWTTVDALLTRIVGRLRTIRVGRGLQVDDGWRTDRDISIGVGMWGWVHLRALVEDHGTGRCLLRVRLQLRPRVAAVVLLAVALLFAGLAAQQGAHAFTAAIVSAGLLLVTKIARDISRHTRQILDVVAAAAQDFGMQGLAVAVTHEHAATSRWTRHLARPEATHGA